MSSDGVALEEVKESGSINIEQVVIELYRKGYSIRAIAARLGISKDKVHRIIKKYRSKELQPLTPSLNELGNLIEKLRQLAESYDASTKSMSLIPAFMVVDILKEYKKTLDKLNIELLKFSAYLMTRNEISKAKVLEKLSNEVIYKVSKTLDFAIILLGFVKPSSPQELDALLRLTFRAFGMDGNSLLTLPELLTVMHRVLEGKN